MDFGPSREEKLHARLTQLRDNLAPRTAALEAHGLNPRALLASLEQMLALLEGREVEEGFDVQMFMAQLNEWTETVSQVKALHDQAEAIGVVAAIPSVLSEGVAMISHLRADGRPEMLRTAAELEKIFETATARMARGEVPAEELNDAALTVGVQLATVEARMIERTVACGLYWEKQTPEWWAKRSPEERKELGALLEQWEQERDELLGRLPLETRRRLEAMTLEDFDKKGPDQAD